MPKKAKVAIVMGSDSDLPVMKETSKILSDFGVSFEVRILSAHRSPRLVDEFSKSAKTRGLKVIIAAAGGAAHLAGVIASRTTLPVIGVPIETKYLKGIDSLFSTVQMPSGIPVCCMAIGKSGAKNAAITALQILGIEDKKVQKKLECYKKDLVKTIRQKNKVLRLNRCNQ